MKALLCLLVTCLLPFAGAAAEDPQLAALTKADDARVAAMLAAAPPPLGASVRVRVDRDGTEVGRRAAGGADGASSSSDDGDDSMSDGGARTPAPRAPRAAPVVDEDGFQTVVRRR
jgi:hypothetical protein